MERALRSFVLRERERKCVAVAGCRVRLRAAAGCRPPLCAVTTGCIVGPCAGLGGRARPGMAAGCSCRARVGATWCAVSS